MFFTHENVFLELNSDHGLLACCKVALPEDHYYFKTRVLDLILNRTEVVKLSNSGCFHKHVIAI